MSSKYTHVCSIKSLDKMRLGYHWVKCTLRYKTILLPQKQPALSAWTLVKRMQYHISITVYKILSPLKMFSAACFT